MLTNNLRFSTTHFRVLGAALLFPLLFTACMEDTEEAIAPQQEALPQQIIELAPDPAEWQTIQTSDVAEMEELGKKKRATTAPGVDRGRYNITLRFISPPTDAQREVFEQAAGRWERIIIKDVPSITATLPSAFGGVPPIDGTIDDIVIEVLLAPIDGAGGVLGQAGPRFIRNSDALTVTGVMFFDEADLDFLDELDLFEEVIVHEMGHVLGIGTLWNDGGRTLREFNADSLPYFDGRKANVFWNAEGGTFELPIEDQFGPGTQFSHWKEATLNNELMTGFLNLGENPLSRITAGSMRDLGYGAAMVGESYDLPDGAMGVPVNGDDADMDEEEDKGAGIHIAAREITLQPIGVVIDK